MFAILPSKYEVNPLDFTTEYPPEYSILRRMKGS
jgi:hypothetical protein